MRICSAVSVSRIIAAMIVITATVKLFVVTEIFAQIQLIDEPANLQTTGLLLQGVNATIPTGREEDIYSIPIEGDIYRIAGNVLNNDTVRFSSVRVFAILLGSNDQIIGEGSAHTTPSGIQPGAMAPFEINIFKTSVEGGIDSIRNFTLKVDGNRQGLTFR
jgi:hypothetical protein